MFKNKVKKEIELYIKDLAIQGRKDAIAFLEEKYEEKAINEKTYQKYKKVLDDYTEQMKSYNHQQFYRS